MARKTTPARPERPPPPKPKRPNPDTRVQVAVRLTPAGLAEIDKRAVEEDRTRSDMIRRMLLFASMRMPKGWTP